MKKGRINTSVTTASTSRQIPKIAIGSAGLFSDAPRRHWLPLSLAAVAPVFVLQPSTAIAAAPAFINLCTGLGVSLPVLQPVATVTDNTLSGLLSPLLPDINTAVSGVNTNIQQALSGRTLGVGVLDPSTGALTAVAAGQCNVSADSFQVANSQGITIGGSQITGLGGTGNATASAGNASSIAFGNGSSTTAAATNATALGTASSVSASNSVALGANSTATRGALSGYTAFGATGTQSSAGEVSVGASGSARQITNVAAGSAATDAVNVGQLSGAAANLGNSTAAILGGTAAYNSTTGTIAGPTFNVAGSNYTTVYGALSALNGANTTTNSNVTNLQTNITNGTIGLVLQDQTSRNLTVGAATNGTSVDLTGTAGSRLLTGVTAGTVASNSVDAVNGSQLFTTNQQVATNTTNIATNTTNIGNVQGGVTSIVNSLGGGATYNTATGAYTGPTYTVSGNNYTTVYGAVVALDGRTSTTINNLTTLQTNITNGTLGLVLQDPTSHNLTVGHTTDGTSISVAGTAGNRQITGVTAGTNATDAVNVTQLDSAIAAVNGTGGSLALASDNTATAALPIASGANSTAIGYGATSTASRSVAVGNGSVANQANTVSVGAVGAERRIVNVAPGTLASGSTDAVNGGQLFTTNQQVSTNTTNIATNTTNIANVQGGVTSIANSLGGGATYNTTTGAYTGPTYTVSGNNYNTVYGAVVALDGRTSTTINNLTTLQTNITNGTLGLVLQDPTSHTLTVGHTTDGTSVDMTGTAGNRLVTGVSAGSIASNSTDAINGSQLFTTNQQVAANTTNITNVQGGVTSIVNSIGGGATYNSTTGAYTGPTFSIGGSNYLTVYGAVTALDGRTTTTINNLTTLQTNITNGTVGLVQQDPTTHLLSIGAATNGASISVAGTTGNRQITGVAAGTNNTDAVNVGQLNTAISNIPVVGGSAAVASDNTAVAALPVASGANSTALGYGASATASRSVAIGNGSVADQANTVSVGAVGAERRIVNVAPGTLASGSTDAVNGGQLFTTNQQVSTNTANIATNTTNIATNTTNIGNVQGGVTSIVNSLGGGATYNSTTGAYTGPTYNVGGGTYNTVYGALTAIDGRTSTTINTLTTLQTNINNGTVGLVQQDQTSHNLTVGASTNGTSISVAGTAGARQINGVAAGTSGTDAVNVTQLDSAISTINGGALALASDNTATAALPTASGANSTAIGFGATSTASRSVAIGNGSVANQADTVSVGAVGAERRIVNVGAGTLAAGSTDAVNGGQLFTINQQVNTNTTDIATNTTNITNVQGGVTSIVNSLGGGATYNSTTGAYTGPTYAVGGNNYTTVYGALGALDGQTTINTTNITNLENKITTGSLGLVQQNPTSHDLTVGASTDGTVISVAGTAGTRTITGIAAGAVAAGSTDAVNGAQLYATNQSVINMTTNINSLMNQVASGTSKTSPFSAQDTDGQPLPSASGEGAVAGGYGAVASAAQTTAVGNNATATQAGNVAIGANAKATADPTVAVGLNAAATANEASAFGAYATASAVNTTALGRSATASGTNALAVGMSATASGANAIAIGQNASATQDNAVAIGSGVATTRANQIAIGSQNHMYTLAGLPSAASTAAQSGPTGFVTTDANGNLAASGINSDTISNLDGRVGNLEQDVKRLNRGVKQANEGVSIALAMAGATLPGDKRYAVSANFGTYAGQGGFAATGVARLTDNVTFSGGIGLGSSGNNLAGRGGLSFAW